MRRFLSLVPSGLSALAGPGALLFWARGAGLPANECHCFHGLLAPVKDLLPRVDQLLDRARVGIDACSVSVLQPPR